MCGRYSLTTPPDVLREQFRLDEVLVEGRPRYNIAPTQEVPAVRQTEDARRQLVALRWGLVPSWAKDPSVGARMLNARAETVFEKPSFRAALKKRRCLVLADGFYEWKKLDARRKQPYRITMADGRPFAFAGLWERWKGEDRVLETCTILTTTANGTVRPIHDRMPVILEGDELDRWLDPQSAPESLLPLLDPLPDDRLVTYKVDARVGNARFDDAACIERLVEDEAGA